MTKTIETIELNDADLDLVTGGLKMADKDTGNGYTATDDLWKVKNGQPMGLKMDDPKKDNIMAPAGHV